MRLGYAIVFVSDMEKSIKFYRDVLEIPLKLETSEWTEFATGDATLALHLAKPLRSDTDTVDHSPPGRCRPGLTVPDLDQLHQRLVQQNVRCLQEPQDTYGVRIAQYEDPDGLAISISETSIAGEPTSS